MATQRISEMTLADIADLGDDALIEIVDSTGATVRGTFAQLRVALQNAIALQGDATAPSTAIDATTVLTVTIADDAVSFAKMQNIAADRLLGRSTAGSGDIEQLTVGSGLTLAGGVLSAAAPAAAAPSATLLTHRAFGGF